MPTDLNATSKNIFITKLPFGADLLEEITRYCIEKKINLGKVQAIGAVQKARLGYYHQAKREYQFFELDHPLEITSLIGNISLKEGVPMVHAHVNLSDENGKTYGGHLAPGTQIFACEVIIEEFESQTGDLLQRGYDNETGLPLWTE